MNLWIHHCLKHFNLLNNMLSLKNLSVGKKIATIFLCIVVMLLITSALMYFRGRASETNIKNVAEDMLPQNRLCQEITTNILLAMREQQSLFLSFSNESCKYHRDSKNRLCRRTSRNRPFGKEPQRLRVLCKFGNG